MAVLKIARMGHPALREQAKPVPSREIRSPQIRRLIDDMIDTLDEYNGIGLAAPQVRETKRIILAALPPSGGDPEDEPELNILINPKVVERSEETLIDWEGCLSIPEIRGEVERPARIVVEAKDPLDRDRRIEAKGLAARVLLHEIDHLDGVLYIDRMDNLESLAYTDEMRRRGQD